MFSRETQALMEAAVDAIIVIDHRGRMQAVNDAASGIFGYRSDELLGEDVSMLMPEPEPGVGREITARRKDGSLFPARLSVGLIPDSAPPSFVGVVRDATAEHQATAELKLERGARQRISGASRLDPRGARFRLPCA
jgi:two-component system sensor kinase FixL